VALNPREAEAIAHELLQHITGLDRTQRLFQKDTLFTEQQQNDYDTATSALLKGTPLQYVTHSAWFMGREYYVNEHTLIPRPETEELVQWIVDDNKKKTSLSILDVGTGSGCIPTALKLAMPLAHISACDISSGALEVAKKNATQLNAEVQFYQLDFLDATQWQQLNTCDIIVSNPPYIPQAEKERLHPNVRDFEPGTALFVPNDDALIFYREIAAFGKTHLKAGGSIYCELDADHATETKELFEKAGYRNVDVRKDMHGNWRMLKAETYLKY
jgi:release factor glutamine methyltransferase